MYSKAVSLKLEMQRWSLFVTQVMARGKIYPNFFLVTLLRNIVRGVRCSLSLAIRCLPNHNVAMFRPCFDKKTKLPLDHQIMKT